MYLSRVLYNDAPVKSRRRNIVSNTHVFRLCEHILMDIGVSTNHMMLTFLVLLKKCASVWYYNSVFLRTVIYYLFPISCKQIFKI